MTRHKRRLRTPQSPTGPGAPRVQPPAAPPARHRTPPRASRCPVQLSLPALPLTSGRCSTPCQAVWPPLGPPAAGPRGAPDPARTPSRTHTRHRTAPHASTTHGHTPAPPPGSVCEAGGPLPGLGGHPGPRGRSNMVAAAKGCGPATAGTDRAAAETLPAGAPVPHGDGTGRAPRHPRLLLRPPSEQRAVPRSTGAPALGPAMASPPGTASASGPLKSQPACCGLGQHLGTCVLGSEQRPRCSSPEGPHGLGTDEVRAAVFQPHAVHPRLGARGLAHSDRERTVVHGKAQRECLTPWKKRPRRLIGPSLPCPSGWDTPDLGETTPVTAQRGCAPAERRRVS